MKITHPWINGLAGLLASKLINTWMETLDHKVAYYDPTVDPAYPNCQGQRIYLFWHEYILFPLYQRGHCNLAMLLSQHRDAEILSHVAHHLGFEFVRGSTRRGGVAALRQLLAKSQDMHLTITPDGPRGPRRRMSPGPIYLASKLGMPIVLLGLGHDTPWRAKSWDRFAIPKPFSRARCVLSPDIHIPANLDRQGVEYFRQKVGRLLTDLSNEAEDWAVSGSRKPGEQRVHHGPSRMPWPDIEAARATVCAQSGLIQPSLSITTPADAA